MKRRKGRRKKVEGKGEVGVERGGVGRGGEDEEEEVEVRGVGKG